MTDLEHDDLIERLVWRKIHAIAATKVKNPVNQLLLDCNAVADAAIADLRAVIERHRLVRF